MKKSLLLFVLTLAGLGAYAQVDTIKWGLEDSRTEWKNDAGALPHLSGFFQANAPVNYPDGAKGWWHLLDIRHSNAVNLFAMQFAGGFYDQKLYFRKTANSASTPWSQVVLTRDGKTGLMTDNPRALFDVGLSSTNNTDVITSVLARLPEWNDNGIGNCLAVRSGNTQPTDVKSFSLEHYFGQYLNSSINFYRGSDAGDGFMTFATSAGTERMRITYWGNVGIGTTTPQSKLAVAGTITAQKVKVTATGWPDFVFADDYQLPSLSAVEQYIRTHRHLPEVPAADEVEKNGQDLGEMNKKLLQKVEELTLYVIELQKQVNALQEKVNK
ncbi:hypothetical protein CLV59_109269 [Chitinophaga dinghuensis]|uniref:Uncharacterized protein n=1 Tax=Chitinophaga dinghuensis TaxID=1539050 RepID=A0A327VP93_9BACT|nr:hypothetical protein [Chitinophaga dinghuensis]RAJ75655.1 hypothetical protein CLV59_109269 [Chitinophaga dinghuensis]